MSYIKSFKDTLKNFGFSKTDSKKLYDVLLKEEIGEELLYEFIYNAKINTDNAIKFLKDTEELTLENSRILEQPLLKEYKEKYMKELLSGMKNKTVNSIIPCKNCGEKEVIATSEQRRSADEEENIKYDCKNCGFVWYK